MGSPEATDTTHQSSPAQEALISVRIVHIDHYTHALHNYSSSTPFQAARLTHAAPQTASKLPVVRIFGTTPAGQRCCVHLHALRPYLHIAAPQGLNPAALFRFAAAFRAALESALRTAFAPVVDHQNSNLRAPAPAGAENGATSGGAMADPSNAPYVADIEPVVARTIYGFYTRPTTFLKVYAYAPVTVSRISTLLTHRALPPPFDAMCLPHSAHIPFPLQFLTDYDLAGMDYLHLSTCKFRTPLPDMSISSPSASMRDETARALQLLRAAPHKRLFTSGLQGVKVSGLFWPFHVAKRSTSPVELDAFAADILNAAQASRVEGGISKDAPPHLRPFVNRTLAVLWEEERLRTGVVPARPAPQPRSVTSGAHLSPEDARARLHEILRAPPSQQLIEAGSPADSTTLTPLSDVLLYLDASVPLEDDGDDDNDVGLHHASRDDGAEEAERIGDEMDDDGDLDADEPSSVDQAWRDIAACTQLPADDHARPQSRFPTTSGARPFQRQPSIPSPPLDSPHTPFTSHASFQLALSASQSRLRRLRSSTPTPTPTPTPPQRTIRTLHPTTLPPRASHIASSYADAMLVEWGTPFYSGAGDYARATAFGASTASIRRPAADGLPAFTLPFAAPASSPQQHHASRGAVGLVTPACKPPTVSQLRAAAANRISASATDSRSAGAGTRVAIDSAGRLVRLRDGHTTHELSLTPTALTAPDAPRYDRVDDEAIDAMLMDNHGNDDAASLSSSASSRDESVSTVKLSRTLRASPGAEQKDVADNSEVLENRPLSPKYDESFQITVNQLPSLHSRAISFQEPQRGQSHQNLAPSNSVRINNPNSVMSLSESPHKHQNVSSMSLEILAKSYSDKLPDPTQNEIIVICTILKTDDTPYELDQSICTVLAVKPPTTVSTAFQVLSFETEIQLFDGLAAHVRNADPDVIVGFETQASSIGYILERAQALGHSFAQMASRWMKSGGQFDGNRSAGPNAEAAAAYYHAKGADVKITGRHIISLWRIVRTEVKLSAYSREIVAAELFQTTFPKHSNHALETWYRDAHADRAVRYIVRLAALNVAIVDKLNVLSRTGELARVYGIDFMSVLTRGSQFRVESMMRRVARARGFLLLTAAREEVFKQPAVEALPLVMEPHSALYVDPVIVLDFQSLYPSVIIAHNLCFSTMLGNANRLQSWDEPRRIGVLPFYSPPAIEDLGGVDGIEKHVFIASNGEMFVDASVRQGILPQMLDEILETRVMVKTAMKSVTDEATRNLLNARQFGLKMIANVTYGYTSASFSGRMPCAGLADAIVQCGRDALEQICDYVDSELQAETGASIVYGDTDSLFVRVRGATREEAFKVGKRIVSQARKMFPAPMALKLEKVYQPCVLQTKKRYVGYSYESPRQAVPIFDAKGIETVRRDTCPLVQKALERSIRLLFETKDLSVVKRDLRRLCGRLYTERVPFADFIFRREVRLASYKAGHLPPAAIVATKSIEHDPRAAPRHGERVPFVVVYDKPGALLKDCVIDPETFLMLADTSGIRLNMTYYITKQLLPALDRIFSLVGVRVASWYADFPRKSFVSNIHTATRRALLPPAAVRKARQSVLPMFYAASACAACRRRCRGVALCRDCVRSQKALQAARYLVEGRRRAKEARGKLLLAECRKCARATLGTDIDCRNVACATLDEIRMTKRVVQMTQEILSNDDVWGHD